jgi:outer membrane immunogenic protein
MKKLALALVAAAAFTGSASAADMPARAYTKAPPPVAPVTSWTGCWISGGGGYGIDRIDHDNRNGLNGFLRTQNSTSGLDGWLVTAGVGCDYQFSNRWVVGAFVDGTWSDIKGDFADRISGVGDIGIGRIKNDWSWSVGGRVGYLVAPNVLSYVNAGYTQTHFTAVNIFDRNNNGGLFTGIQLPGQTFNGLFVGSGVEYSFDWLPGLFLKTEGRAAWFDRKDSVPFCVAAGTNCAGPGAPVGFFAVANNVDSRRPITYMAKTELVYRFNWGGPVVARY